MNTTKEEFNKLDLELKMEAINKKAQYAGNRVYYNHRVNLYTLNGFFVEVHYNPEGNNIEKIEAVTDQQVTKAYQNRINLKL